MADADEPNPDEEPTKDYGSTENTSADERNLCRQLAEALCPCSIVCCSPCCSGGEGAALVAPKKTTAAKIAFATFLWGLVAAALIAGIVILSLWLSHHESPFKCNRTELAFAIFFWALVVAALIIETVILSLCLSHHESPFKCNRTELGWKLHSEDTSCFMKMSDMKTFEDAQKDCEDTFGGYLADVRNAELLDWLEEQFFIDSDKPTFIGGKFDSMGGKGVIEWLSGNSTDMNEPDAPVDMWAEDEPSSLGNNTVDFCMGLKFGWNDIPCDKLSLYICEVPAKVPTVNNSLIVPVNETEAPDIGDHGDLGLETEDCRFEVLHKHHSDGAVCVQEPQELDDCKDYCFEHEDCQAFDWNFTKNPWGGCRCYTHMSAFDVVHDTNTTDHYRKTSGNCEAER